MTEESIFFCIGVLGFYFGRFMEEDINVNFGVFFLGIWELLVYGCKSGQWKSKIFSSKVL